MQPLKTPIRPVNGSTIGCPLASDRSMTFSRRWPSATRPRDHDPDPSGPRSPIVAAIRSTAATSARRESNRISPARPHMPGIQRANITVGRTSLLERGAVQDLDRDRLAVRRGVRRAVADLVPDDGGAQRAHLAVDVEVGVTGHLAATEQELHLL